MRIGTNQRLGEAAVSLERARAVVQSWQDLPHVRVLLPKANHFDTVMDLMRDASASGAVLSDAVLAGYAIANRATLFSNDSDFAPFAHLDWQNPLAATE